MTQKVCQKSAIYNEKTKKFWVNAEILSRLKALLAGTFSENNSLPADFLSFKVNFVLETDTEA